MRAILDKDYERLEKMAVEASSFVLGVALQESCYDYEIVKLLIEAGASVDTAYTELDFPIFQSFVTVMQMATCIAAKADDPKLIELFIAHGADVNKLSSYSNTGIFGQRASMKYSPLFVAVKFASPKCVRTLLNAGATVTEAIIYPSSEQTETLLNSIVIRPKEKNEPHHVREAINLELMKILIEQGKADVNQVVIRFEEQADSKKPPHKGRETVLHQAVLLGQTAVARFLIDSGADVTIPWQCDDFPPLSLFEIHTSPIWKGKAAIWVWRNVASLWRPELHRHFPQSFRAIVGTLLLCLVRFSVQMPKELLIPLIHKLAIQSTPPGYKRVK